MSVFNIINPYSNKIIETYSFDAETTIEQKINTLFDAQKTWNSRSIKEKKEALCRLGNELTRQKIPLATTISTDMGKPFNESLSEVQKCVDCCLFYKDYIKTIHAKKTRPNGVYEPLGVIFGIMPWNYPLWQLIRFMVPTVCSGNTCLIKPSPNAFRVAKLLQDALNLLPVPMAAIAMSDNRTTGQIIAHPRIAGVSFTGSVSTGKHVATTAAGELKPCVLELGGSDPLIVFKDADLPKAIQHAIRARFTNAGQVCISAKRFLFEASIYEKAKTLLIQSAREFLHFGDPLNPTTTIGPLARIDIKNKVEDQVIRANISPHHIIYKHHLDTPKGNAVPPLIIDGEFLDKSNPLFTEEVFGPVAICDTFKTTEDAIQKANATPFGLGASVWTSCPETIRQCSSEIICGTVAINTAVHTSFDVPFGGRKKSGLGLELGIEGALSFTGFKALLKDPFTE